MNKVIRIGTRQSELATWQARQVASLLADHGIATELVFVKSEGDIDLKTPLYEMGVQGIFTRSLDIALLNNQVDIAVHSMKDVPTQLPKGISQAAVLERASWKDLLVYKLDASFMDHRFENAVIATSSIRRRAQWLHYYPHHTLVNLRGNINTRLAKVQENEWQGAIFAAAGVDRINIRPENSLELDWMLPAPAQGAIMVVCRTEDEFSLEACAKFNNGITALCTKIERDFLRKLMGGCSTPIAGLAEQVGENIVFKGNILSVDGTLKAVVEHSCAISDALDLGTVAGNEILENGGKEILQQITKESQPAQ
ncbi:MAG: hydroxymethylbilane synthase [Chitinophagaceae bacterium]|nr:MAG: hydroxymethylbilane synthase [Chitinophagaceae bacterium]